MDMKRCFHSFGIVVYMDMKAVEESGNVLQPLSPKRRRYLLDIQSDGGYLPMPVGVVGGQR